MIGGGLALGYTPSCVLARYSTLEQAIEALELFYQFLIKKFKENNQNIDYSEILSFIFPEDEQKDDVEPIGIILGENEKIIPPGEESNKDNIVYHASMIIAILVSIVSIVCLIAFIILLFIKGGF